MIPNRFRLIAVSADIVRSLGADAAIWLGNAISSQDLSLSWYNDAWWYGTKVHIEKQTGLSDERQETARRKLCELGILEEKRGILKRGASLATIWYTVNFEVLESVVCRRERRSKPGQFSRRSPSEPVADHTSVTSSVTSEQSAATRNNVSECQNVTSPEQHPTTLKAKLNERTLATSAGNASQQQAAASADEYGGRRPRSKRAPAPRPAAPTIEEWHAYAKTTFPWWPAVDCEGAYAHYEKNNWAFKDGRAIANWKGCARTCSNNWKRDNAAAYMAARRSAETAARAPYAPFGGE